MPLLAVKSLYYVLASLYLMNQYLIAQEGGEPDWELKGLIKTNEQLQLVNHAFWQRTMTVFKVMLTLKPC